MNKKGQSVETKFSILFFSRDDTVFSPGVAACVLALLLCVHAVCKVLCFILPDNDFEIISRKFTVSTACLVFIHILNCKMSLFFGFCFFLNGFLLDN